MARTDFIPLVDMVLSRQSHDRWYQAYEYHREKLADGTCDRRCRVQQYIQMSRTLTRTIVSGVLHTRTIALRSDCTLALVENAQREYLIAIGATSFRLPEIERELTAIGMEQNLGGPIRADKTLYSVN